MDLLSMLLYALILLLGFCCYDKVPIIGLHWIVRPAWLQQSLLCVWIQRAGHRREANLSLDCSKSVGISVRRTEDILDSF